MTHAIRRRSWVAGLAAVVLTALVPGIAAAEPPAGDDFDSPAVIGALPFETTVDTAEATTAADDPWTCQSYYGKSVWFQYTAPADGIVRATVNAPGYWPFFTAYTGKRGDLTEVPGVCSFGSNSPETFPVKAGETYHILVAANYNDGGATTVRLESLPPAANDDLARAQRVPGLPTVATGNLSRAGLEPGEPTPSCDDATTQSLWYSYSPATARWVSVIGRGLFTATTSVYRASDMSEVDCATDTYAVFRAEVGETYLVRVAARPGEAGLVDVDFRTAPALRPSVATFPEPATVFQNVYVYPLSGDSLNQPVVSGVLDFGDGTSTPITSGDPIQHRYAEDGDYRLSVSVTTEDGRSGTGTGELRVETHDVAVSGFAVPDKARTDQTKQLSVTVTNTRYDENVEVVLYKQTGDYFSPIGTLRQWVPAGGTVRFPFAYTFSAADATAGSVTFRATARFDYPASDANTEDNDKFGTTTVRP